MKNRLISTLTAALLACAGLSAPALAQDKGTLPSNANKAQAIPGKIDPTTNPVTVEKMDDNVQRQHDRKSSVAPQGSGTNARTGVKAGNAGSAGNAGTQARLPPGEVRDWSVIDKNKDNLISPEEMEAALADSRSSSTTTK